MLQPIRILVNRAGQRKHRFPVDSQQAPVGADHAFVMAFPGLVKGLDDVVIQAVAVHHFNQAADESGFVNHAGYGVAALPAGGRPARFADQNRFIQAHTVGLVVDLFDDFLDMAGCVFNRHRLVFPVGQNVHGNEVHFLHQLWIFQINRPNIGIRHGLLHGLFYLADIADQFVHIHVLAQQDFVADQHPFHHVRIGVHRFDQRGDFLFVAVMTVAQPAALNHFHAVFAGERWCGLHAAQYRVSADGMGFIRNQAQVGVDMFR